MAMNDQQKIALIKGIARGLYHLHSNNIVHRDLAARNVLVSQVTRLKLPFLSLTFRLSNSLTSQELPKFR